MRAFLSILTAWVVLCLTSATALAQSPVPLGNEARKTCHVAYEGHKDNIFHSDCLACHTPEAKHLDEGGKGTMKFPTADNCLACHKNNDHKRMNWAFSEHKKAKLECRDCHGVHSPKIKELNVGMWKSDKNSALCISCHKDVAARMTMPSHHPVKEGKMACSDCHDPHGQMERGLKAESLNLLCWKCHADKQGPFAYEHPPVTENYGYCHAPHGTVANSGHHRQCRTDTRSAGRDRTQSEKS